MSEEPFTNAPEVKSRFFSIGQIILATLFGMPVAGCLLLARNYQLLGKKNCAWYSLAGGIVSSIVLLIISFWLPESFPNMVLPAAYCFAMRQLIIYLQGGIIDNHLKGGGSKSSWAVAVATGLLCLVIILGLTFSILTMLDIQ